MQTLHATVDIATLSGMKIVRFESGGTAQYGILDGKVVRAIADGPFHAVTEAHVSYHLEEIKILAPCSPSKIVAVGINYRSHALEMGNELPESPLIFLKPPTTVIGPDEDIIYPPSSKQVDYEGELGVVIGKTARRVPAGKARDYVLGYTCLNDVTARDLQRLDGQWTRSKGFDTFAPFGPCIETEVDDTRLPVQTFVNGRLVQEGNTSDLIFGVAELVSFISDVMTLLPGDVVATGTPGGVGPIQPGDTVEVRIDPIGTLRNRVVRQYES